MGGGRADFQLYEILASDKKEKKEKKRGEKSR